MLDSEVEVVSDVDEGETVGCDPTEDCDAPWLSAAIPPSPGKGGGGGGGGGAGTAGFDSVGSTGTPRDETESLRGGDTNFSIEGSGGGGGATFGRLTFWLVYLLDCRRCAGEPDFPPFTSGSIT